MGFKDAERAYAVMSITGTPKVVLVALAHRADDKTHRTIVGQDTLADMIGQGVKTVQRALGVLESADLIVRKARFRKDGPRTSDEITLTLDHPTDSRSVPSDKLTTSQIDQESDSPRPPDNLTETTGQIVPAYKDGHSEGQSVGHSGLSSDTAVAATRPEIDELLDLLDSEIIRNGGKAPNRTKKNRDAVRLMLDRDGYSAEQIARAIQWCQADEFWRSNILSASKLRQKYEQLRLAAMRTNAPRRLTPEQRARQTFAELSGADSLSINPPMEISA